MPTRPITGPLTRSPSGGVTGVGGGAAWAAALPALRTFITANYNQPNPHNQAVMASPPTISTSTTTPSGLTVAARYKNASSGLAYYGGDNVSVFADYRRFPVATIAATGGNVGNGRQATAWRVSSIADSAKISFRLLGSTIPYRMIVEGRYIDLAGTLTSTTSGTNYITLDFGSRASRSVVIEGEQINAFDGIHYTPGDVLTTPAASKRMAILGDSFTEGTGATRQGDGFGVVAGDMLGILDVWNSGVGGTGYIATATGTKYRLSQRIGADLGYALSLGSLDVVVIAMGVNDIGQSGIQAEAESCISTARALAPSAQMFVVGPWDVNAPAAPVANYAACKSAIQAAVSARGGVSAGIHFLDPQGVSFTKADAVHPDTAGHKTLGDWLALQIKTALGA